MKLNAVLPFSFWISVNDTLAKSKDTDDKAAFYTSLHCFKDIKKIRDISFYRNFDQQLL